MSNQKANILLPIETSAREFDQRIFMGVLTATKNKRVLIGDQQIIRLLSFFLKNGVFYGKHLFGKPQFSDMKYYKRLKNRNFKLVYLSEEGAVFPGNEKTWEFLLEQGSKPSLLNEDDVYCTWGDWQKKHALAYDGELKTRVEVTGHPRFDLYNKKYYSYFEEDVKKLKNIYGDYFLFNTSFSLANNGTGGEKYIFKPTKSYDVENKDHRNYRFNRYHTQLIAVAKTVKLINQLSLDYPNKTIVLRPHPSENTELYLNVFQNVKNVKVIYEGSVTPWILGCEVLFHSGCTTAIEAYLSGKKVISYTKSRREDEIYLAEKSSLQIDDYANIIKYLEEGNYRLANVGSDDLSSSLFENIKGNLTMFKVHNIISDCFLKVKENFQVSKFENLMLGVSGVFYRLYWCLKLIYLLVDNRLEAYKDFKKRFEVFKKEDVIRKVSLANKILNKNVKVKYHNKYLFSLISDENDSPN